jgi:hypothetical protein
VEVDEQANRNAEQLHVAQAEGNQSLKPEIFPTPIFLTFLA